MKEKYLKPEILVEVLAPVDVLLQTSGEIVVPTQNKKFEKENVYKSFGDFIVHQDPADFFK